MLPRLCTIAGARGSLIFWIVLAALSSGCATMDDALKSAPRPSASIIGANVQNLSLQSLDLVFDIEVTNPYGVALALVDFRYAIESGEFQLMQGNIQPTGSLPANGSSVLQIPARLDLLTTINTLKGVKPGAVVPYQANFSIAIDAPVLGRITLPLQHQGEIPIPALPEFSLASFDIASLSLDEVKAIAKLRIKNTNQFGIILKQLGFDLELNKTKVTSIRMYSSSEVGAGQATIVEIPLSFLPRAFGAGMFNLLRGNESGYGITGILDVDTQFGAMSLSFSQDGKTVIRSR